MTIIKYIKNLIAIEKKCKTSGIGFNFKIYEQAVNAQKAHQKLFLNIQKNMAWMTKQLKWQYDNEKRALRDEGSQGGYSPELESAIETLNLVEKELE